MAENKQSAGSIFIDLNLDTSKIDKQLNNSINKINKNINKSFSGVDKSISSSMNKVGNSIDKSMQSVDKSINKTSSNLISFGKIATAVFVVKKIAGFANECMKLGSDLQEVQNIVDTVFPNMSSKVQEFANNSIKDLGMSETSFKKYISTFGSMAESFKYTEEEALNMGKTLTDLTGDVSSFYNLSHDEAYTKLKSVFTGETESLKELGVVMTQAALEEFAFNQGMNKSIATMTEKEKVALRLAFVTDALSKADGDFIKTSKGWANQTRILSQQFLAFKTNIGQGLINVFTPIIQQINLLMTKLIQLSSAFNNFTSKIFGFQDIGSSAAISTDAMVEVGTTAEDASSQIEGIGNSAVESAKKAQKALLGFDKINKLDNKDAGTAAGTTTTATSNKTKEEDKTTDKIKNLDLLKNKVDELKKSIGNGFNLGLKTTGFENSLKNIKSGLEKMKGLLKEVFNQNVLTSFFNSFNNLGSMFGSIVGTIIGVGASIAEGLINGFNKYLQSNKEFLSSSFISIFDNLGAGFKNIQNIALTLGEILSKVFKSDQFSSFMSGLTTFIINPIIMAIELISKLFNDITAAISNIFNNNKEGITTFITDILTGMTELLTFLNTTISDLFAFITEQYNTYIKPNLEQILLILGEIGLGFLALTNPIAAVIAVFVLLYSKLEPFREAVNSIISMLSNTFEFLLEIIGRVIADFVNFISTNETLKAIIDVIAWSVMNFISVISQLITWISDIIIKFKNWAMENEKVMNTIVKITEVILGTIAVVIAIGLAIANLPIVVGAAIALLLAAFITFYQDFEKKVDAFWADFNQGFIDGLSNIKEWFISAFTFIKDAVSGLFTGMGDMIVGVFNGIVEHIKGIVNTVLGMVNTVINGINGMSFDIPEWVPKVGGKNFAPNIPTVPMLANGGYVGANAPQLAIVGDNKTQGEIIAPEGKIAEIVGAVLDKKLGNNTETQPIILNNYTVLDGKLIYKETKNMSSNENSRTGNKQFR